MKKSRNAALSTTFFAALIMLAGTQSSFALPVCNYKGGYAGQFLCENGERYLCRLNGVGSFSPDSGRWIHRGKCTEGAAFQEEAPEAKEDEAQEI
jgi:hypothetical protein